MIRKNILTFVISLTVLFHIEIFANSVYPIYRTNLNIIMDKKKIILEAYNINGYNYIKMNNLCKELNWHVKWDDELESIKIDTFIKYDNNSFKDSDIKSEDLERLMIDINGYTSNVRYYEFEGNTYFRLREISNASIWSSWTLDNQYGEWSNYFTVEWNDTDKLVLIENTNNDPNEVIEWSKSYEYNEKILKLINRERNSVNVELLKENIFVSAIDFNKPIVHLEDKNYTVPEYKFEIPEYKNEYIRMEMITKSWLPYDKIMELWMDSEEAKTLILDSDYENIAIGSIEELDYTVHIILLR